jgi:hypothetical protein
MTVEFIPYAEPVAPFEISARMPAMRGLLMDGGVAGGTVLAGRLPGLEYHGPQETVTTQAELALPALRSYLASSNAPVLRGVLEPLRGFLAEGEPISLDVSVLLGALPGLRIGIECTHTKRYELEAELPAARGLLSTSPDMMLLGALPALHSHMVSPSGGGYWNVVQDAGYWWLAAIESDEPEGVNVTVQDSLALYAGIDPTAVHVIREQLVLSGAFAELLEALVVVSDRITFTDVVQAILLAHVRDVVALGDTPTVSEEVAVHLVDAIALAAGTQGTQEVIALVSVTLALMDAGYTVEQALARSGMTLGDAVQFQATAYARLIEEIRLAATPQSSITITALVRDELMLADAATMAAELLALVRDGFGLLAHVHLSDEPFIAWVLNTESRAAWTYDQWPFNSYCAFQGRYLAAGPDGIYTLGGQDDAGAPIEARIRTGLTDLGATQNKRMEQLYLLLSSDGRMGLRVITTRPTGEKVAHDYEMLPRPANAPAANRIKIGRGLASRSWSFELRNLDGGDFKFHDLKLLPMILDRRI